MTENKNMTEKINELCRAYSVAATECRVVDRRKGKIASELDAELGWLQACLRRHLTKALKGTGAIRLNPLRVWASIDHGKNPVTVRPVASVTILVRKGVKISLDFSASEEVIKAEMSNLRAAILAITGSKAEDELNMAWVIIANAGGGDWQKESPEWRAAASKWRDRYHALLPKVEKSS